MSTQPQLSPLEQLEQSAPQPTAQPSSSGLSPLEQLEQSSDTTQAPPSGQVTNDVGNTVIVPKPGESFADTMQRAAKQGKATTQVQINAELATAPKKAAEVVGAAPAIGAGGTAALGGLGELIVNSPEIGKAVIKHLMEPGSIFKFPAGRAVEYYLAGKLGLSKAHSAKLLR